MFRISSFMLPVILAGGLALKFGGLILAAYIGARLALRYDRRNSN